ncbi:hypothetical protein [Pontibacter burrus]|nr:hypothetical protein [Pontibacter burrus]
MHQAFQHSLISYSLRQTIGINRENQNYSLVNELPVFLDLMLR